VKPTEIKVLRELKDDAFARTQLVEMEGCRWLRKEYRFRGLLRDRLEPLARRWTRHEMEVGRVLAGIDGTPGTPTALSDTSFLRPWIDGEDLHQHRRAGRPVSDTFFDELRMLVEAVHERGIGYADLAKRDNIIVGTNGRPHLIDFQISLRRYEGPSSLRRRISSWWLRHTQADDLRYVYKHKRRIRPDLITPEEVEQSQRRSPVSWFKHLFFALTLRRAKRWVYPKGSNDVSRFSKPRKSPR
jgi:hypothetical protein